MTRLFDIALKKSQELPNEVMLAAKENGVWITHKNRDVVLQSKALARGMVLNGLYSRDTSNVEERVKVALVSPNRPEWLVVDLAVQQTGAVLTPIYPTISNVEFEYVLNQATVEAVFFANQELYEKFKDSIPNIPTLKFVYTIDEVAGATHYKTLLSDEAAADEVLFEVEKNMKTEDVATIIYTSGTTGKPKGVMLSHANIMSNVIDTEPVFHFAKPGDKALSFLPLNHIFERTLTYIYINAGVSIYYAESMDTIGENLKEVKPSVFTCVPRLLEKVYEKIMANGYALTGIKKSLFFWAVGLGNAFDDTKEQSWWYRFKLGIANKLIFSKWRAALGGNVQAVVSGAAALNPKLAKVFIAGGITVMEGYGLTETSPVISVNLLEQEGRRIGTVGLPIRNVAVKIAEDGEILVKGPNVMVGYYKNPEQTAEVIDTDGWFHTGDIGTIVEGRFLKITDRKKEIFKTSGGKYVAPQAIEGVLRESNFIEQVIVIGPGKKFVSALIYPNFEKIIAKLQEKGIQLENTRREYLINNKDVIALIQKNIDYYNPRFNHVEQIKKFELVAEEWSVDNGLLTPKLSMRRKLIYERYEKEIERLYSAEM